MFGILICELVQRIVRLERELVGDRDAEAQVDAGRAGLVRRLGVGVLLLVEDVEAGREPLVEEIGLGERDAPAAAVLAFATR